MLDFHEAPNIYLNLNVPLNDQQHSRLNNINGVRDDRLKMLRLKKEN